MAKRTLKMVMDMAEETNIENLNLKSNIKDMKVRINDYSKKCEHLENIIKEREAKITALNDSNDYLIKEIEDKDQTIDGQSTFISLSKRKVNYWVDAFLEQKIAYINICAGNDEGLTTGMNGEQR